MDTNFCTKLVQEKMVHKATDEKLKKLIEEEGKKDSQDTVDMSKIEEDYARNKDMVVDLLVKNVLSVNIEIPKVVKGAF